MYHGNQSVQGGGSWNTAVLVRVYNLQHRWTDVSEYHKIFRNLRDSGRQGDRTQVLSSIYHGFLLWERPQPGYVMVRETGYCNNYLEEYTYESQGKQTTEDKMYLHIVFRLHLRTKKGTNQINNNDSHVKTTKSN